ncbi:glycerate kinase [Marinobacter sp. X15-166B]|uniref:glycerate kinase family protein n=1 Tax=Marinobacter sp. X15-166B TaxID=1897620 RepID=UPI00085BB364|nr:glycerate kinase [Marinobacter sp. X15-166B]OEY66987.1 glycerate kinase [Marinobacter sp. X15-166B]
MRVIIAPDSFKECLPAETVADAIATGWLRGAPADRVVKIPLADGGEGTTTTLVGAMRGTLHQARVSGPSGAPVDAVYGLIDDGKTAIVEVAEASGLHCVAEADRNAMTASSYGTGELIMAALKHRPETLIVCLGGSATTDGGAGLLQALGAQLLDRDGRPIPPGGAGLRYLSKVDVRAARACLDGIRLVVACDVTNPLLGADGAAAVFGPQKGATPDNVHTLDNNLRHFASCVARQGYDISSFAGSGAAGGLGGTVAGILNATLQPGIELVMNAVGMDAQMQHADLVITAEGAIDGQSASGKTPTGVARLAQNYGVPVIGLAGQLGAGPMDAVHQAGVTALFAIAPGPISKNDAIAGAARLLEAQAEQLARLTSALQQKTGA